jgi:hypothetical protein
MFQAAICLVWRSCVSQWLLLAISCCALGVTGISSVRADQLFAPPGPNAEADEILLVSARAVGTACDGQLLSEKLLCQRYEIGPDGRSYWKAVDWREALLEPTPTRTVIYVHGNRVEPGEDRSRGMMVYHSLVAHGKPSAPIRYIIWSWPATPIPGPLKDMHVKAARTRPAGWQLAWFLDQLPAEAPLTLVGYSYGARVISGSLHLLGGGKLNGLELTERFHPERGPMRVAMIAAAFDADWIQPGRYHERALSQVDELVLITNHRDPAMRLYHFSVNRGRIDALGKAGVPQPSSLGEAAQRIVRVDATAEVGRSHSLEDYLAARGRMNVMWRRAVPAVDHPPDVESSLSGATSSAARQLPPF